MKNKICAMVIGMLISSYGLLPKPIDAAEIEFYPRLETGIMFYAIKFAADNNATLTLPGETSGSNNAEEKKEYIDTMSFIGGGATFFINRVFIDLSGQYVFEGNDSFQVTGSIYDEKEDNLTTFISYEHQRSAKFDHTDYAIAAGYAITEEFSIFAGYKWANTGMDLTSDGSMYEFYVNYSEPYSSLYHIESDIKFKYEGPFIGATHGWEIDMLRFFKGLASVKIGIAYLNSKYIRKSKNTLIYLWSNEVESWEYHDLIKGNTWGFTLGLGWRGITPIKNLSYSISLSGYRYNFNSKNSDSKNLNLGDVSETAVSLKAGISYAF